MTVQGKVIQGTIVPDQPLAVPDGTRVEIQVRELTADEAGAPTLAFLTKYAGCMPDLPPDFAEQHDHYVHGTSKR